MYTYTHKIAKGILMIFALIISPLVSTAQQSRCTISGTGNLKAQNNEVAIGLRIGHNASFGGFAAASAEARGMIDEKFIIHGGAQYNTIGKVAAEARPSYFHDFSWGRLSAEAILSYTNFAPINSFAGAPGASPIKP